MGFQVMCSRGCGHAIGVTTEVIESLPAGQPLNVSHEVCPTDTDAPMKRYGVSVQIVEWVVAGRVCTICDEAVVSDPAGTVRHVALSQDSGHEASPEPHWEREVIAKFGGKAEAGSFKLALPKIKKSLDDQWQQIVSMADVVDQVATEPQEEGK